MKHFWLKFFVVFVGVLIVLRIFAPLIGLRVINSALEKDLGTYQGHIKDFDLSLYRGAYQLQGLTIKKKGASEQLPPLVAVKEIDLSLSWNALFHRKIAADVTIFSPHLSPSDSNSKEKAQIGTEEPTGNWKKTLDTLIPIQVQSLIVQDGQLEFTNQNLKKPLPVRLDQVSVEVTHIQTHTPEQFSPIHVAARLQEQAHINVDGKTNFLAQVPQADLDFKLEGFKMNSVNQLLRAYVPLDITKGTLSLYGEVLSKNGDIDGYVKVFMKDSDIIATHQKYIGVKHFFYEILTAFGNWLLTNTHTDMVATEIPFKYEKGKLDVNSSKAFWSAVKNKGDALKPGIEHRLKL